MKNNLLAISATSAALLFSVGCAVERGSSESYDETRYDEADLPNQAPIDATAQDYGGGSDSLSLTDAQLRGTIGGVGLDGEAWVDGYAEQDHASIYSTVEDGQNGAGMTIFLVEGGLDHAAFSPGSHLVFNAQDAGSQNFGANAADDPFVSVVGCSGPNPGAWQYDRTADTVTVDVSEAENGDRIFAYTARFNDRDDEPSMVSGTFTSATP